MADRLQLVPSMKKWVVQGMRGVWVFLSFSSLISSALGGFWTAALLGTPAQPYLSLSDLHVSSISCCFSFLSPYGIFCPILMTLKERVLLAWLKASVVSCGRSVLQPFGAIGVQHGAVPGISHVCQSCYQHLNHQSGDWLVRIPLIPGEKENNNNKAIEIQHSAYAEANSIELNIVIVNKSNFIERIMEQLTEQTSLCPCWLQIWLREVTSCDMLSFVWCYFGRTLELILSCLRDLRTTCQQGGTYCCGVQGDRLLV